MPLHPVSDYLDLRMTQAAGVFEGVGEVWQALPRIAPWLAANLTPQNDGEVRGQAFIGPQVQIGRGTIIFPGVVIIGPAAIQNLGLCYLQLSRWDDARACFTQLFNDPAHDGAARQGANLALLQQRPTD